MKWCVQIVMALVIGAGSQLPAAEIVLVAQPVLQQSRLSWQQIDHSAWNDLLTRRVDAQGNVAYAAWKSDSADLAELDGYLQHLASLNPLSAGSREQQLAYWINAYNAVTVLGILNLYPTSSIRNHTPLAFGFHIWKHVQLPVADDRLSLEDIEHRRLRTLGDPRIHFAIVCASRGCPRLANQAYRAENLASSLDEAARQFFAEPTKFQYDAASETFRLSQIFQWFGNDFGASQADRLRWLAGYLSEGPTREAATRGRGRITFLPYDWQLNDQAPATAASDK